MTVTANDSANPSVGATQTFTWTVNPLVTLADPGAHTNAVGDTPDLFLSGTDSAGNAVTYSASGLPAGLNINSSTGLISGTVSSGDNTDSPYSVSITATDSTDSSASASQTFQWTINAGSGISVSLTGPGNQTSVEESSVNLALSATDSASNAVVYGASNLPAGLTISPTTGVISGTIQDFDSIASPYSVTFTATDSTDAGVGASQTVQWTVNPLVTLANPGSQTNAEGDTVYVALAAADSSANALTYSASGLPSGLAMDPATGIVSGTIASGAHADSPYSVTVTATDSTDASAFATQSFQWTVNATGTVTIDLAGPGNQTSVEGASINVSVSATDSAGNPVRYSAAGLPDGLSILSTSGLMVGTVQDGASAGSPYSVTITATDGVNPSVAASQTFVWVVNPLVTLSDAGPLTDAEGDSVYVPLTGGDSAGNLLTFSASGLPGGLTVDANSGIISGTVSSGDHANSPYSVTVTVTDSTDSAASASQSFEWTINSSGAVTVALATVANQTNSEGDSVSLAPSATDSADNALTWSAAGLPDGLTIDAATGAISGTLADWDSDESPYTVTLAATDSVIPAVGASETFQWTVNPALTLSNPGAQTNADGDTVNLSLAATDSAANAVNFSASGLPSGLVIDRDTGVIP